MGSAAGPDAGAGGAAGPGAGGIVPRSRLFGRLAGQARVSVVSASAGSGKTVLVRSWISQAGLADCAAWVAAGRGERDPQIAAELYVSHNTVRTHMRHLYTKLGTHRRAEAVAPARALGLLAPSPHRGQAMRAG
jgi:ATP/maltotriose-dependent transcriptional regulator MalT